MINSSAPALVVFTYNRLNHTKRTIEKLQQNTLAMSVPLYIFSDGPKLVEDEPEIQALRAYLAGIDGFFSVTVIESEVNQGLAESIIKGITSILEQYQSVKVVEEPEEVKTEDPEVEVKEVKVEKPAELEKKVEKPTEVEKSQTKQVIVEKAPEKQSAVVRFLRWFTGMVAFFN